MRDEDAAKLVNFNRTTQSFRNLMNRECDALIVSEPNAAVYTEMEAAGFAIDKEEISTEALIFVVNENNPVESLTTEQIRDIYSGKITNWKEVGGNDAPIAAFQRNEGAGSQALMRLLVMKDTEFAEAPEGYVATEMGELMRAVKAFDGSANAIGYSVYYYANDMKMAQGLKIIAVDGVEPDADTIRARKYPHLNAYYCVIPKDAAEGSPARILYDWMVSDDGQRLVAAQGYVSVKEPAEKEKPDGICSELPGGVKVHCDYTWTTPYRFPEEMFERLAEGPLEELSARDDYGKLYVYYDNNLYETYEDGYGYSERSCGLFDAKGRLVTDPVYTDIFTLTYTGPGLYSRSNTGLIGLEKGTKEKVVYGDGTEYEEYVPKTKFASLDGSFVTEKEYGAYSAGAEGICLSDSYDSQDFEIMDYTGKTVLTSEELYKAHPELQYPADSAYRLWFEDYGSGYYLFSTGDNYYFLNAKDLAADYIFNYASGFLNGKAIVGMQEGEEMKYGLLSAKDGLVVPCTYREISLLSNGSYAAYDGEKLHILDEDLKELFTIRSDGNFDSTKHYLVRYFGNQWNDGTEKIFYDPEGKVAFDDADGLFSYYPSTDLITAPGFAPAADGRMNVSADGDGMWVYDLSDGSSRFFPGLDTCWPFYNMDSTYDLPYLQLSFYDPDTEINRVLVIDEDLEVRVEEEGWIYGISDDAANEIYLELRNADGTRIEILDRNLKSLAVLDEYPVIWDGLLVTSGEQACEAVDFEGNLKFRRIMSSAFDD